MAQSLSTSRQQQHKLILIDDDRVFSLILKEFAESMNIDLDCYASLSELGSIGGLAAYDGAILDYDLGEFNGLEIAQYFEAFFKNQKPVVLVSGKDQTKQKKLWPQVIETFVHKDSGPQAILDKISGCLKQRQRDQSRLCHADSTI